MSDLYDTLYEDLKACALSAIPVDSDDGTTFIRTDGAAPIWGPPEVVADAVATATYTVVGIRLDDARAEGVAAGRKQAAADALRSAAAKLDALPSCPTYPDCTAGEEPHDRHETPGATLLRWADDAEGGEPNAG